MKKSLLLLCVLLPLLLGSDLPRGYDSAIIRADDLSGEWTRVDLVLDGNNLGAPRWVITFTDGKYSAHTGGDAETGTYRNEKGRLELVRTGGFSCNTAGQFLYRIEDNTLKLSYHNGATKRPEIFGGPGMAVSTFKRVKK
jgi:hypothetical protein